MTTVLEISVAIFNAVMMPVAQKSARNIQIDPDSLNLMPAISAAVFE
jgi:hypothetical protein